MHPPPLRILRSARYPTPRPFQVSSSRASSDLSASTLPASPMLLHPPSPIINRPRQIWSSMQCGKPTRQPPPLRPHPSANPPSLLPSPQAYATRPHRRILAQSYPLLTFDFISALAPPFLLRSPAPILESLSASIHSTLTCPLLPFRALPRPRYWIRAYAKRLSPSRSRQLPRNPNARSSPATLPPIQTRVSAAAPHRCLTVQGSPPLRASRTHSPPDQASPHTPAAFKHIAPPHVPCPRALPPRAPAP
ncbi:hypothetical protein DFH09DRAFT_1399480 [Mycena vulgaris]|nr:hypothetical protein DFH09DRAFT_1399480 [Mycena vulgaris]